MTGGPGLNEGHGHVWKRPDGVRARCGGPNICKECAMDFARKQGDEVAAIRSQAIDDCIKVVKEEIASWKNLRFYSLERDDMAGFKRAEGRISSLENVASRLEALKATTPANDLATQEQDT